jgi:hypothetical protein
VLLAGIGSAQAAPPSVDVSFIFTPVSPLVGQVVTFTSTSKPTSNDSIKSLNWDLDGNNQFNDATGTVVTRSFGAPGAYTVGLQAVDKNNRLFTATQTVTVHTSPPPDLPPRASFVNFPAVPVAHEPVSFYSTSTDPDSPIASQSWDLDGDAQFNDGSGPTVVHSFAAPGAYLVALRVVDTQGAFSIFSRTVTVGVAGAVGSGTTVGANGKILRLMNPFPVVRISGTIERRGTRLRRLSVSAPSGAVVTFRCRGRSCPIKRRSRTASSTLGRSLAQAAGVVRVRRLEHRVLRPGVRLAIRVTKADAIGKYTRFKFRRAKPPLRLDRCLVPGNSSPVVCP